MLTQNKNPKFSYLRRIIILPLMAVVVLLFAFRIDKTNKENKNTEPVTTITLQDTALQTSDTVLWIVDGVKANQQTLKELNPQNIKKIDILKNKTEIEKYGGDDTKKGVILITTKKDTIPFTPPKNVTDEVVQVPASFPGGQAAWQKYLETNLDADIPVKKRAPVGKYTVVLTFIIDKEGNVSNVKAENNPGYGTAEEAVRVIKNGPAWVPAMQNGKNVICRHRQSITFKVVTDDGKKTTSLPPTSPASLSLVKNNQQSAVVIPDNFSPANGNTFNIKSTGTQNISLAVFNRWGNVVYKNDNYKNNWDGKNLEKGTYFIKVMADTTNYVKTITLK